MTETVAWGRWDCTRCGQKDISGKHKRCTACGDPREQAELDAMRPPTAADFQAAALGGAEKAEALAGADWTCGFCGTTNAHDRTECQSCGGSREHAVSMGKVGEVGSEVAAPLPERETGGTGHPDGGEAPTKRPTRPSWWTRLTRSQRRWTIAGGVIAAIMAVFWWGWSTHEITGAVTRIEWRHITERQRWGPQNGGGWGRPTERAEVKPVGGKGEVAGIHVRSCYQKHHSDEQYACGTESYTTTESYSCGSSQSCRTVNNGNGSYSQRCETVSKTCSRPVTKTRTKYCTRPIYREWCDYDTHGWDRVESATASGQGHELRWESLTAMGDLERIVKSATYTVVSGFGDQPEASSQEVSREEYDTYDVGTEMIFTVENFGTVESVRRAP